MKLITPVLVPINVNMLKTFKILEGHNVKVDILENFNYQQQHYDKLLKYIDPNLLKECIKHLVWDTHLGEAEDIELEQIINEVNNHIYTDYFRYFLCSYIQSANEYEGLLQFWAWLQQTHDFTIKKTFKPEYVNKMKVYNTILIPELWRNMQHGNLFNRIYEKPANYFDQFDILKKSVKHLTDGGRIYLINKKDYSWVINNIGDEFTEIETLVFEKNTPEPKSKKNVKLWL